KQDSKFRIRGAELTRFEYYRVTCIIEYHVRDFAASVPPGLVIFNETHEKIESGNNGNWKAKKITYVCKSSASNMGIDITALGGVERDNSGSQLFYYACNMLIEKMRAESTPIYADSGDINPIHKIREILTDDTAMNKPESDVNDVNFLAAADRIWDEGLGISWAIQEKTCKEAIDELLYHIEAGIRVNRQTGKYEVILFRDDLLNLNTAMQFNESNIKNLSREVANQDDVINVLNVKYYDRESIKESAFSVYDNGSIMSNGNQEIAESVDFPYFMVRKNAELVANWKLKQLSTPTWKGSFSTGKYEARKLNKYDVIKLSWLNAGFVDMPVRVMKISLGDGVDNTVSIDWVEVVPYSSSNFQPINVDPPTNVVLSAQPNFSKVFEMPYFEACQNFGQTQTDAELANNPDLGYLMIASNKPQNNSLNALLYTNAGAGYKQQATINYCPTAVLDQNIGYLDTSFAIRNIASISSASVGSCILVDDEIMVYQAYNPTTKVLTVKR
ncbi:MAG: phage tail protein, partial [Acinetobacter sp.]